MDYTPTPEQVERGLADENAKVQEMWIRRLKVASNDAFGFDAHEEVFSI